MIRRREEDAEKRRKRDSSDGKKETKIEAISSHRNMSDRSHAAGSASVPVCSGANADTGTTSEAERRAV